MALLRNDVATSRKWDLSILFKTQEDYERAFKEAEMEIKGKSDSEPGNVFPGKNKHGQLGDPHNQHNKKQQNKKALSYAENNDNSGQLNDFWNDDDVIA